MHNESGHIVSAGSVIVQLFSRVNYSLAVDGITNDAGTGEVVRYTCTFLSLMALMIKLTGGPHQS